MFNLEPLHSIFLGDPVLDANTGLASPAATYSVTGMHKDHIEVHPINTGRGITPGKTRMTS